MIALEIVEKRKITIEGVFFFFWRKSLVLLIIKELQHQNTKKLTISRGTNFIQTINGKESLTLLAKA